MQIRHQIIQYVLLNIRISRLWHAHCKSILLISIQNSPFYSFSFDESLNPVIQSCQMDTGIRYWNETNNTVESWYIDSQFLQRQNAKVLLEKIKTVSKELPEGHLLLESIKIGYYGLLEGIKNTGRSFKWKGLTKNIKYW